MAIGALLPSNEDASSSISDAFSSSCFGHIFTRFTCHVFLILQDVEDASFHFQLQESPLPQSWMWYAQHLSCWVNLWFNTCRLPSWIIVCGMLFCVSSSSPASFSHFFGEGSSLGFRCWCSGGSRSSAVPTGIAWIHCFHPFGVHKNNFL